MSLRALRDPLLRRRCVDRLELMDDPACDPVALDRTYRLFALVNPLVAGWGSAYGRVLRPVLRQAVRARGCAEVLDVGSGGGDLARSLAWRAARDGLPVTVVGIDPDERAHAHAVRASRRSPHVQHRRASSTDLVAAGERFDVIVSNHVLHHLDDRQVRALLADTAALRRADGIVVHNDLRRHRAAWLAWWVLTLPLARTRTFLRYDGLLSIRRSRTVPELAALVGDDATVRRHGLFRVLAIRGV